MSTRSRSKGKARNDEVHSSLQPHIIDEIAHVLAARHHLGTLSNFSQTCKVVYESSVQALYEGVRWDELDVLSKHVDAEEGLPPFVEPETFLSTFVRGYGRGKVAVPPTLGLPDPLGSIKVLTLQTDTTIRPSNLYHVLAKSCPRLVSLSWRSQSTRLDSPTDTLLPNRRLASVKHLNLSFPHWTSHRLTLIPTREQVEGCIGETGLGKSRANSLFPAIESIELEVDMSSFAGFDFGVPPHPDHSMLSTRRNHKLKQKPVPQKPTLKIYCFDDELYHAPWIAQHVLGPKLKALEIDFTPRRGQGLLSGTFTEHCQLLADLVCLKLSSRLVSPHRLPRNTASYALKGSELKDMFRDMHEHLNNFGRLEYEAIINSREVYIDGAERNDEVREPTDRAQHVVEEVEGQTSTCREANVWRPHASRQCCAGRKRYSHDKIDNVVRATAIITCKGSNHGLEVKATQWKAYKDLVMLFDEQIDALVDGPPGDPGNGWFPVEGGEDMEMDGVQLGMPMPFGAHFHPIGVRGPDAPDAFDDRPRGPARDVNMEEAQEVDDSDNPDWSTDREDEEALEIDGVEGAMRDDGDMMTDTSFGSIRD